ncbi:MAG: hypothetical protein J6T18_01320 [Bacteroidaceae bacterium]|nr:hypothetical protein [Bacteroidaceae bacterium]
MRIRRLFLACLLTLTVSGAGFAQTPDRTKSPVLQPGEGLTKSKKDVEAMRNDKQEKRVREADVYVCALSFSPVDSVMFLSNIQKMENAVVRNRWFLEDRAVLEKKFEDYVRERAGNFQLSSIFFSEKEKKVLKQRERIIRKNNKKKRFKVQYTGADFRF